MIDQKDITVAYHRSRGAFGPDAPDLIRRECQHRLAARFRRGDIHRRTQDTERPDKMQPRVLQTDGQGVHYFGPITSSERRG